jgi:hypothetical protein
MTTDQSLVNECGSTTDQQSCNALPACKWYQGKVVANNTELPATAGKLGETNICHPPSNAKWDEQAPHCLVETNQQACEGKGCMWSTGEILLPEYGDFCNVDALTQDATAYSQCANHTDATTCPTPACKWYCQPPAGSVPQ